MLQEFKTYELKEFQGNVSVAKSYKNFSTNVCVRNLPDFHLTKSLVQETGKIFIMQENWCKKLARF